MQGLAVVAGRRFFEELVNVIQKNVIVEDTRGNSYEGILIGYDANTLSLCLGDVRTNKEGSVHRVFLFSHDISKISVVGRPFDLEGLVQRLERVFPKMVRLYSDAGVIVVMDKIRVSDKGVIEGTGPAAERVQSIYELFMKEAETST